MRILFLAHRTPYPPNKGEKIRAFHVLSHLAKKHEVSLVYWVDDPRDLEHTAFLQSLCRGTVLPVSMNRALAKGRAVFSLLRGRTLSEGYYSSRLFGRAVAEACAGGRFDAVYVYSSAVAAYGRDVAADRKLVDFVDVDSDKWGQLAAASSFPFSSIYRAEERRLSRWEAEISHWAHRSLFISRAEADLFKKRGGTGAIEVLPSGLDFDVRCLPVERRLQSFTSEDQGRQAFVNLIFVGSMNYHPNIDAVAYFATEILPLIRRFFPRVVFRIIGRSPARSVLALKAVEGVEVIGEVEDVRPFLLRSDISVAPMRMGRGVQYKVLEAMAMGIPVVASPAAIQGIDVLDGEELFTGATPEEFASKVIKLLNDRGLRRAMTHRAWKKMKRMYHWDAIGATLEELLNPDATNGGANSNAVDPLPFMRKEG